MKEVKVKECVPCDICDLKCICTTDIHSPSSVIDARHIGIEEKENKPRIPSHYGLLFFLSKVNKGLFHTERYDNN